MLRRLWFKGYRNLEERVVVFHGKHVLLIGENNHGKTNFLESLHVLSSGKSPLDVRVDEMVCLGESEAALGLDFEGADAVHRVYFRIFQDGRKEVILDKEPLKSFAKLRNLLAAEYLSADVIRIFQESPDFRRRDMDRFCTAYYPGYGVSLRKYERVLRQRNAALKMGDFGKVILWDPALVELAQSVVEGRLKALDVVGRELVRWVREVKPDLPVPVRLHYKSASFGELTTSDDYAERLAGKLACSVQKELGVGYSLYGPHRDDFFLTVGGRALFTLYSRGVNRMMAILLKLSQLILLKSEKGRLPIFLLDDTFAELAFELKRSLMRVVCDQTCVFYSTVLPEDLGLSEDFQVFRVNQGVLSDG